MTFISIIIPFDKPKRYLKDCLDSLSQQNLEDEEIILVLNGVNENLDDLLNGYSLNFKIISFDDEIGVAKSRNEALKIVEGEYVYFIDSDDYIFSDALAKLIEVSKSQNADFINGERINTPYIFDRCMVQFEKLEQKNIFPLKKDSWSDEEFSFKCLVGDKTDELEVLSCLHALIKKDKIGDILFDESDEYQSDYGFMIKVLNNIDSFVGVEDALYAKRIRDDPINLASLNQKMGDESFLIYTVNYKKAIENIGNDLLKQIMAQKLFDYYYKTFSIEFLSNPNKKWRNEHFDIISDLISKSKLNKLSFYQKREVKALKNKDKSKLHKLLKIRVNFKKLLGMNNMWRIKIAIYYKIFNKKELNKKQIIFVCFKGDYYSDNPKYLYEYMYENYKDEFDFVWVMNDKNIKIPGNPKTVKRYSLKYYNEVAKSKYWVVNGRHSPFLTKRKDQVIVSTWHGTPLKKLGLDISNAYTWNPLIKHSYIKLARDWNYLISPNDYTTNIYRSAFGYEKDILETGYPRNDVLYNANEDKVNQIKGDLNIPKDKKVILYAPTWRDDDVISDIQFKLELDLDKMKQTLGDEYVLLIRTHYFISDKLDLSGVGDFTFDVSKYDDIAELYLISDILITDYSSVFFDFANLKRPILFYTYDLDRYENVLRGFYLDIHNEVPGPLLKTTDEVIDSIVNIDDVEKQYAQKYDEFYERFCSIEDGNASKRIVEKIWKK